MCNKYVTILQGNLCRVKTEILFKYTSISCQYSDILWESDFLNKLGAPVTVKDGDSYHLRASDFVEVNCEGEDVDAGITDRFEYKITFDDFYVCSFYFTRTKHTNIMFLLNALN